MAEKTLRDRMTAVAAQLHDPATFERRLDAARVRAVAVTESPANFYHRLARGYTRLDMTEQKIRVLIAKPGLDGHDRGAKVVARALRDAGFEVIYTGLHQTPDMIASAAIQEDVDCVGLSIMSGAHNTLFPAVIDALRDHGADDMLVFGGGIIPEDDIPRLQAAGVKGVFTPGTPLTEIIDWIRANARPPTA